ncbi:dihydrofolate reductase-like isoform X2 [Actinia tenebrosa]|uniref:dihydrofolate reductase n=1 Tax=Actinia tenebrosa TaxID=6105 RepID=A0A6P8HVS6_ACTTE|nr:dihydrofolate reductase-like isoform X2 [Actinia tenebrosa]
MTTFSHGNEMKYFSRITSDVEDKNKENAVIMGRKTWESIPEKYRPLPDRLNIVLSRTIKAAPEKAEKVFSSLDDAFTALSKEPYINTIEKVFVIGGPTVYKDAIAHECCKKIYLTHIDHDYDCDIFFPEFDTNVYKLGSEEGVPAEVQKENGVTYKFCVYERD